MSTKKYDVVIIGAGHNGLVAAAYLAKAGKRVIVLEANSEAGGATTSVRAFPEFDAHLSRYSYLVSLLPDKIIRDLNLNFKTISRSVASFTPFSDERGHRGLHISRVWDDKTSASFEAMKLGREDMKAWKAFYSDTAEFAKRIAPSLLQPLPTRSSLRNEIGLNATWDQLIESPIGNTITARFRSDVVRGIVLTDGLIGTFASAFSLQANKCFLYHIIGNGTGEWKVPQGGMGQLTEELMHVAQKSGVTVQLSSRAAKVETSATEVSVTLSDNTSVVGDYLLSNAAPQVLSKLRGQVATDSLDGAQLKVNMLVKRLPALKSGADPLHAFAGTFHVNEGFDQLEEAYQQASSGEIPSPLPLELYCHTLTDNSIMSPELQRRGYQSLTLFGLHTPAALFDQHHDNQRKTALNAALASLNEWLAEPIESVLAQSNNGEPTIEVKTPLDIEAAIGMPRGNIFHRDLSFPFREDDAPPGWGVETDHPKIFICGAGAIRGGGVSGIPGHNAAMAVINDRR
ncbi:NAD(P)/FAD-dependent oxidoreductase [Chryseolinea sp. T2]|uniref:phytoene desaturase family protein n=1 Tax=Chryseolinea sp. T2 TaxID=3129255 RepID=UPI0030770284